MLHVSIMRCYLHQILFLIVGFATFFFFFGTVSLIHYFVYVVFFFFLVYQIKGSNKLCLSQLNTTCLLNGSCGFDQPNMTCLLDRSDRSYRVIRLFKWVISRLRYLTHSPKRVVLWLTLNGFMGQLKPNTLTQIVSHIDRCQFNSYISNLNNLPLPL